MRLQKILHRTQPHSLPSSDRQLPDYLPAVRATLGANMMILGGFLFFIFFNSHPPGPEVPVPQPSSTSPSTVTPTLTATPFEPAPLTATSPPSPTWSPTLPPTSPPAPTLPVNASIIGISGRPQSMPLSCESRSAVDWAAYFGRSINEYNFFNGLPVSDNPEKGFVGSVYGSWGQIPPNPYGVHAKPIAQRLREFGLKAKAVSGLSYQQLKTEIASGQPVIVWVIGHVGLGTPVNYTARDGQTTTVAKFEHTVIVIGYTEHKITVLDGAKVYSRYQKEFQKSWGVLGNQAVIWID